MIALLDRIRQVVLAAWAVKVVVGSAVWLFRVVAS